MAHTKLLNPGAWLGLLFGLVLGTQVPSIGFAAADKCDRACQCQTKCTESFKTCNEDCNSISEDERAKCVLDCNDTLLKCIGRCGGQDCDCGGGY